MRKLLFLLFALVCILGISINAVAGGPNVDPRCDGLSGAAFGLCNAAIAVGCDDPATTKPGCDKIEENFIQITGEEPPWTQLGCIDNSQCAVGELCHTPDGNCGGLGACEAMPYPCVVIYEPVCGCDGNTYGNECEARAIGISIDYEGECAP